MMRVIDPKDCPVRQLHQYLVGAVAPRPIAFVSTVDREGRPNLAPYSFFNVFSSNPPTLVFSSNRKVQDGQTKDTLQNVETTGEAVINVVSYSIVRQMTIASIAYPPGTSEYEKSGLTPIPADLVRPFRVKESPVHFECKVQDIIKLGDGGGAGHLIICQIVRMHIDERVLDEDEMINPHKIDLMGRMGRAYYTRASGESIYTFAQPVEQLGIGYDQLPLNARQSKILTGNNLGQLAGLTAPPDAASIEKIKKDKEIQKILASGQPLAKLQRYAQKLLAREEVSRAAAVIWLAETFRPA
jgi:flavin reductase (DIM6/NTAB) family NADH-FMN oxidoreductase RutF